ncbi:hypothetical protein [Treponema saccharophilum]|uniref:hypothetical protein n=1 Tax=Treponema saccharophilum TaxID=165 RepID=UPI00386A8626
MLVPDTTIVRFTFPLSEAAPLTVMSSTSASPGRSVTAQLPETTSLPETVPVAVIVYSVPPSTTASSSNENERFSESTYASYVLPPPEATTEYEMLPNDGRAVRAAFFRKTRPAPPRKRPCSPERMPSAPARRRFPPQNVPHPQKASTTPQKMKE